MNVYDFDGTIYDGDSSVDFYRFCIRKRPWLIFVLPWQVIGFILFSLHLISKEKMKECYFSFLKFIPNNNSYTDLFWDKNICRIQNWYLKQRQDNDLVISASPLFLVQPACNRIGIKNVIASDVDYHSGHFYSLNCHDINKVKFFKFRFPDDTIREFYSDSLSDEPMARLAEKAFFINKGKLKVWPFTNAKEIK